VLATVGVRVGSAVVWDAWVHAEEISAQLAIPQSIEVRRFRMSGLSTLDSVCFFRAVSRARLALADRGPALDDSIPKIDPKKTNDVDAVCPAALRRMPPRLTPR
jgi:hypothetical protein